MSPVWLPWSEWWTRLACGRRRAIPISSAETTSSERMWAAIAHPTTHREKQSVTAARQSLPSPVAISLRSATQSWLGAEAANSRQTRSSRARCPARAPSCPPACGACAPPQGPPLPSAARLASCPPARPPRRARRGCAASRRGPGCRRGRAGSHASARRRRAPCRTAPCARRHRSPPATPRAPCTSWRPCDLPSPRR